jgi:hypothetical protein
MVLYTLSPGWFPLGNAQVYAIIYSSSTRIKCVIERWHAAKRGDSITPIPKSDTFPPPEKPLTHLK